MLRDTEKICDKKLSLEHTQSLLNIGTYEIDWFIQG